MFYIALRTRKITLCGLTQPYTTLGALIRPYGFKGAGLWLPLHVPPALPESRDAGPPYCVELPRWVHWALSLLLFAYLVIHCDRLPSVGKHLASITRRLTHGGQQTSNCVRLTREIAVISTGRELTAMAMTPAYTIIIDELRLRRYFLGGDSAEEWKHIARQGCA